MEVPPHNSLICINLNWPMSGDDLGVHSWRALNLWRAFNLWRFVHQLSWNRWPLQSPNIGGLCGNYYRIILIDVKRGKEL